MFCASGSAALRGVLSTRSSDIGYSRANADHLRFGILRIIRALALSFFLEIHLQYSCEKKPSPIHGFFRRLLSRKSSFNVINANATHENDTGSPEVQVAIWTERIRELTEHLKAHPNDDHSRLGMYQLVGKRRRMLDYLAKKDIERYRAIIAKLNIRK